MHFKNNEQIWVRRFLPELSLIALCAFLNLAVGCSYYKVTPAESNATAIEQIQKNKKYVVLHQGTDVWLLKDISVDDVKKVMTGRTEPFQTIYPYYKTTKPKGANRYKPRKGDPTYEVHIYISEYAEGENSKITIALSAISKMEVYDKDVGATVASYVFTTIGVLAGAAVVILAIALLMEGSCPFVYINDGISYQFTGEMYGGAIYSSLERDDYMPLTNFTPFNGEYQLKISNELLEKQHTNLAELMAIEHPDNIKVLLDKNGNIQTVTSPQFPSKAISDNNGDYTRSILSKDSSSYLFNDDHAPDKNVSSLTLSFKKPVNAKTGKLILNAKNSFWLDYIYGKFNEQFGTSYNAFAEKQKKVPAKKNIQWSLEQGIPLSVYVESERRWEFVDYFNVMGPLASRDLVMPLDLSKVKGEDLRIRLECGFMFWEIDYAAIDFAENVPVVISHLSASSAIDENGKDVSALLASSDDQYLIQPEVGNEVTVKYTANQPSESHRQTTFLHSRGYYEYIRDYKGKPNLLYLNSFKKKGAFTLFSKQRYFEFVGSKDLFARALNSSNGN